MEIFDSQISASLTLILMYSIVVKEWIIHTFVHYINIFSGSNFDEHAMDESYNMAEIPFYGNFL